MELKTQDRTSIFVNKTDRGNVTLSVATHCGDGHTILTPDECDLLIETLTQERDRARGGPVSDYRQGFLDALRSDYQVGVLDTLGMVRTQLEAGKSGYDLLLYLDMLSELAAAENGRDEAEEKP